MQGKPLSGWRVKGQWGCVTFENLYPKQEHGAALISLTEKLKRTYVMQNARQNWCGKSLSNDVWVALPAYCSATYRKDIEQMLGAEAEYFVPNHDNFRLYLCSS